jgi:hypothetical protein
MRLDFNQIQSTTPYYNPHDPVAIARGQLRQPFGGTGQAAHERFRGTKRTGSATGQSVWEST